MSLVIVGNLLPWVPLDYLQDEAQIVFVFSLAIILTTGWVAALVILGVGRHLARRRVVALGSMGLGVMTIATPLGVYISLMMQRGGILQATAFDFLMVSVLGFVGGIIAAVAFLRIWLRRSVDEVSRGGRVAGG